VALADAGLRVTVLEASRALGGRARSWVDQTTGDTVDIGPHLVHSEYRNFPAFLERLGTRGSLVWQPVNLITIATQPPVRLRHWPLPAPLSLLPDFLRAPGLRAKDMLLNTKATLKAMAFGEEDVAELDRLSGTEFLRGCGVSEPMIDWFWRLASMAVMNVPLERCSAAALMRVHSTLIGHRRLHFGFPAVGLSDLYVQQSVRAIEGVGGRVLLDAPVRATRHGKTQEVTLEDGSRLQARYCVLALPPQELHALQPALADTAAFKPSAYISTYLWFDRRITDERFWARLCAPGRLNTDFYDLANIRPGWSDRPSIIACNLIFSQRVTGLSDEEVLAATLREIAEFAPAATRAKLRHARVHRIPMAIACPHPGTEQRRPAARTAHPGVFLAGDWTATRLPSSMESAVRSGFLAAEEVLALEGRPRQVALEPRPADGISGLVRRAVQWRRRRS